MADLGFRALSPVISTPSTTLAAVAGLKVPASKEWSIHTLRATNVSGADQTVTVSVGASGEIAFNVPVRTGESVNILGPDFLMLPPGAEIYARASNSGVIRLVASISERDL